MGPDQTKEGQASSTERTELRGVCDVCLSQLAREVEVRVYALTQRSHRSESQPWSEIKVKKRSEHANPIPIPIPIPIPMPSHAMS